MTRTLTTHWSVAYCSFSLSSHYSYKTNIICFIPPQSTLEEIAEKIQEGKEVSRGSCTEKTETPLLPAPDSTIHPMPRARGITLESGYIGVNRNLCLDLFPSLTSSSSQSWLSPSGACPHPPLAPPVHHHQCHGCQTTWHHHPLSTVMAATAGGISSQ